MRKSVAQRFWEKVRKDGDRCWIWQAAIAKDGYGKFRPPSSISGRKIMKAHRFAYYLATGHMPDRTEYVMHSCDVPICVNPAHLRLGSPSDNVRDMVRKGRGRVRGTTPRMVVGHKGPWPHCVRGHPFTDDNIMPHKRGRECRVCKRERDKLRRERSQDIVRKAG